MHLVRGDLKPATPGTPGQGVVRLSRHDAQGAFEAIYTAFWKRAIAYAVEYGDEEPEDAAQQAFTLMWTSCYEDGEVELPTQEGLLFKILRDVLLNRRRDSEAEDANLADPRLTLHLTERVERLTAVKHVAEEGELSNRISYIIETLPQPRRGLFRTALHNGWDVRAAAEECGANYATARWHVAEALRVVRAQLERDGHAVPKALQRGRRLKRKDS
jgi:DNA-directed RNA polymerase specialized sigma24 family protein